MQFLNTLVKNKEYAESSKAKNKAFPVFNWENVRSNCANQPRDHKTSLITSGEAAD